MENCKTISSPSFYFFCCLLGGLFLIPKPLFSQDKDFYKDSLQAVQHYENAIRYQEKEDWENSVLEARKSTDKFAELKLWSQWYESHFEIFNGLYSQGRFEESVKYLQYSIDIILAKVDNQYYLAKTKGWLGRVYQEMTYYDLALDMFLEEVKILEEAGNPKGQYGNLNNLSILYSRRGDYDQALIYLEKEELINLRENNTGELINVYWNKGKAYWAKGNYSKAIESYYKSKEFGLDEPSLYYGLGEVFRDKGELDKAILYAEKALQGYAEFGYEEPDLYVLIGSIYWFLENYDTANEHYQKALKLYQSSDEPSRRAIGRLYLRIGDVYFDTNQPSLALENYQNALHECIPSFKNTNPDSNPSIEGVDPAYCLWIMEALDAKGRVFQKQYTANNDPSKLDLALNCYETAFQTIDFLRYHQKEEDSKIDLINYAHPIYEHAIRTTFVLYNLTKEEKYLDQAFVFSQRTKAFLLSAALQNINARVDGGVPDSLIQKEENWKQSILELSNEILDLKSEKNEGVGLSKLESLEAQRFEAKRNLQKLLDDLEQEYPKYYQLKYEDKVASIAEIRSQVLNGNTAMIDYFLGDSSIFILTITDDKVDLQEIIREKNLDDAINAFISEVSNPDFRSEPDFAFQRYKSSAYGIFKLLLEKSLTVAGSSIDQLIIIPDGVLNTLPFEALLMKSVKNMETSYAFSNLAYVLEDYAINYHYAPQVLLEQQRNGNNVRAEKLFAGFAPDFSKQEISQIRDCAQSGLSSLEYNLQEVELINELLKGEAFLKEKSSLAAFKKNAKDFQILHLATHACMSAENPLEHKIYFTAEEYLSTIDLFNLPLEAEMVVLSACETGIGKIVKGEGVMNLARGFSYTGCPSVMMSLWSVSDKASSEIMIQFYKELDKGLDKDEALRAAKLHYISINKSAQHHPYYWAAFVSVGDASPLQFSNTWPNWIWYVVGIVVLIFGILYFRKG